MPPATLARARRRVGGDGGGDGRRRAGAARRRRRRSPVTGIAGPDGGTPEKPVGLVYLHAETPGGQDAASSSASRPTGRRSARGRPWPRSTWCGVFCHRTATVACELAPVASRAMNALRLFCALTLPDRRRSTGWSRGRRSFLPGDATASSRARTSTSRSRSSAPGRRRRSTPIGAELGRRLPPAASPIVLRELALPRDPQRRHARLRRRGRRRRRARPRSARAARAARRVRAGARAWLPHVTVVRFRERPRLAPPLPGLGAVVRPARLFTYPVLRPTGAEYVVVQNFALGGG